jgi:hypothetical protein
MRWPQTPKVKFTPGALATIMGKWIKFTMGLDTSTTAGAEATLLTNKSPISPKE